MREGEKMGHYDRRSIDATAGYGTVRSLAVVCKVSTIASIDLEGTSMAPNSTVAVPST